MGLNVYARYCAQRKRQAVHFLWAQYPTMVSVLIALLGLACFVAITSALVVARGVCCADDAQNAIVAKNLALGHGFSSSIDATSRGEFSLSLFDGVMTTSQGPTGILPASFAIWIFGNRYWVPGATHITIWALLLAGIWAVLWRCTSPARSSTAMCIFLALVFIFSSFHFEQWYAFLGEVPAALLLILGTLTWASDPHSRTQLAVASLVIGLAILTKILAAIYVVAFVACVAAWSYRNGKERPLQHALFNVVVAACCILVPIFCFELWKFLALGAQDYIVNLKKLASFVTNLGVSNEQQGLASLLSERSKVFYQRYGVSLSELLLVAGGTFVLTLRAESSFVRWFSATLLAGALLHAVYWLLFSVGWARYFYIALVVLCFQVSMFVFVVRSVTGVIASLLVISLISMGTVGRIAFPIHELGGEWFRPSPRRDAQALINEFLDSQSYRKPFIGSWAGSIAEFEYLQKGVLNFRGYRALTPEDFRKGFLLVTNTAFDPPGHFKEFTRQCGRSIVDAPPYSVYDCRDLSPQEIP